MRIQIACSELIAANRFSHENYTAPSRDIFSPYEKTALGPGDRISNDLKRGSHAVLTYNALDRSNKWEHMLS